MSYVNKICKMIMILLTVLYCSIGIQYVVNAEGVSVFKENTIVSKITLNKSKITLNKNDSITLKANVIGESKKVTWKSSNNRIATVNSKGKVTAKKAGTVTITAKANGTIAKCVVKICETKRITATIKNNFPQQFPYYSTLIIKYGKNQWKFKFKDRFGEVYLMDLNGDGKDEIIVRLAIIGSTYGAAEGVVYSVTDKGIVEILKITNENISRYIPRAYACVDVLCHNNSLEIWGKTSPDIYKKITLKWNGKNWKY